MPIPKAGSLNPEVYPSPLTFLALKSGIFSNFYFLLRSFDVDFVAKRMLLEIVAISPIY